MLLSLIVNAGPDVEVAPHVLLSPRAENYLLAIAGAVISVLTFWFGYRKSVGAAQERARAANAAFERTVLRRLVQEQHSASARELEILVDGFAREYDVKSSALMTPEQVLTAVYTRVADSDFITGDQREKLLGLLGPSAEAARAEEPEPPDRADHLGQRAARYGVMAAAAVAASALGTFVTALPNLRDAQGDLRRLFPEVFATSLAAVATLLVFLRARARQNAEEPERARVDSSGVAEFENEVAHVITQSGAEVSLSDWAGADFAVSTPDGLFFVEAKAWDGPVSISRQRAAVAGLEHAVRRAKASAGWLVVRNPKSVTIPVPSLIRVLGVREVAEMPKGGRRQT
jgi:hypothetical protein